MFSVVARRLRGRNVAVRFFEPGRAVGDEELTDLTLLMNKKVDPHSYRALRRAESLGIRTWNGTTTMLLGARLVGYHVLERAGARVPPVTLEKPDGDYVAKTYFDWHFHPDPELNGEGDVYQELVEADPVDYKYYAVDTGDDVVVRVLRARSKLRGEKEPLGIESPDPEPAEQVREVMRLTDTQAIDVDFVEADGQYWAVDVNPAMSFRGASMKDELVESVLATLPDREDARKPTWTTGRRQRPTSDGTGSPDRDQRTRASHWVGDPSLDVVKHSTPADASSPEGAED